MRRIKIIPIMIISTILVFIVMGLIGFSELNRLADTIPYFDGHKLDYGSGKYTNIGTGIICIYAVWWLAATVFTVLSQKFRVMKKVFTILCVVIVGIINLLIAAFILTAPSSNTFEENYCPEYYVVYDRDKTVKLLFAEGMYYFDAVTEVYYLDDDNRAYKLGQFSADEMLQGGKYDIIRQGNKISFSYNYGTVDKNKNPVFHDVSFYLPFS